MSMNVKVDSKQFRLDVAKELVKLQGLTPEQNSNITFNHVFLMKQPSKRCKISDNHSKDLKYTTSCSSDNGPIT